MHSRTLIAFVITALLVLSAFAEPGVETARINVQGKTFTRCITPSNPGLLQEIPPLPGSAIDQEVLWTVEHPTAIANNVDISGNGVTMLTGWYLNDKKTSKYAVQGTGTPIWDYAQSPNFYIPVSSSDDAGVLASTGDVTPLNVWLSGAGPTPSWQFTYPPGYLGVDVNVSDNGTYIAAVARLDGGTTGKLFLFNSTSATPVWEIDYDAANQVNGVEISEDNNWILVTTYSNFYVFNLPGHSLFYTGSNYSQTMGGMDADAEYVATGDFYGVLHVYQRNASGYTPVWTYTMGGWVTAVDISSNGQKVMAGNFTYSPVNGGKVQAFNIGSSTPLWTYSQYGDYVSSVALCDDGSKGVAGSWGMLDATFGDVFTAFNISDGSVILNLRDDLDEPGTIFDVAISDDGHYAVCGGKSVHARTFGNGGEIYSIELAPPSPSNVTVTMTPIGYPFIIPPGGGAFNFTAAVTNHETAPVTCDAWIMVQAPDTSWYGPLFQIPDLTLPGGQSISRTRQQYIPGRAPAGLYHYEGRVGIYPNQIWNSSNFTFTKQIGAGEGNIEVGIEDWLCSEVLDNSLQISSAPQEFRLSTNYPNPFNPSTTIRYDLPTANFVNLTVYDLSGRTVATLVSGMRVAGSYEVVFDGSALASGVYIYRLNAGNFNASGKMALLK
ncbi:MAG: T9SS type A sorting domain-containing protein [bacterium]|nr:T9SS type A sorting domain-containing protein [bacterium]